MVCRKTAFQSALPPWGTGGGTLLAVEKHSGTILAVKSARRRVDSFWLKLLPVVQQTETARISQSQGAHPSVILLALDFEKSGTDAKEYVKYWQLKNEGFFANDYLTHTGEVPWLLIMAAYFIII